VITFPIFVSSPRLKASASWSRLATAIATPCAGFRTENQTGFRSAHDRSHLPLPGRPRMTTPIRPP
jgi:hypothetical protein